MTATLLRHGTSELGLQLHVVSGSFFPAHGGIVASFNPGRRALAIVQGRGRRPDADRLASSFAKNPFQPLTAEWVASDQQALVAIGSTLDSYSGCDVLVRSLHERSDDLIFMANCLDPDLSPSEPVSDSFPSVPLKNSLFESLSDTIRGFFGLGPAYHDSRGVRSAFAIGLCLESVQSIELRADLSADPYATLAASLDALSRYGPAELAEPELADLVAGRPQPADLDVLMTWLLSNPPSGKKAAAGSRQEEGLRLLGALDPTAARRVTTRWSGSDRSS